VACEPKALVVQAPKLLYFPARETRPSAEERCEPIVASSALHHQFVLVEDGKLGGKFSHSDLVIPARGAQPNSARSKGGIFYGTRLRSAPRRETMQRANEIREPSGGTMSSGALERGDAPLARPSVTTEPSGRNWAEIGVGLAAAFALIAIYSAGVWAVVVLVQALA